MLWLLLKIGSERFLIAQPVSESLSSVRILSHVHHLSLLPIIDPSTGYLEWQLFNWSTTNSSLFYVILSQLRFFQYVMVYQCSKISYYNTKWPHFLLFNIRVHLVKKEIKQHITSIFHSRNNALCSMVSIFKKTLNLVV